MISWSKSWFDEAVKITIFLDFINPSSFSERSTSIPLKSGIAKSSKIRSKFSARILSNPSWPVLTTSHPISFLAPQNKLNASDISTLSSITRIFKINTHPRTLAYRMKYVGNISRPWRHKSHKRSKGSFPSKSSSEYSPITFFSFIFSSPYSLSQMSQRENTNFVPVSLAPLLKLFHPYLDRERNSSLICLVNRQFEW